MRRSHGVGRTVMEQWIHGLRVKERAPVSMAWSVLSGAMKI